MKLPSWMKKKDSRAEASNSPVPPVTPVTPVFEPQNDLEVALIAAAHEPGARAEFQALLLQSDLYVGTPDAPSHAGVRTLAEAETFQILNVADQEGRPIPALFSSEPRLAATFGAGIGYLMMPAASLLEIIANDGAILNPGHAYGVMWSREDILHMLGRPVSRTLQKDTKILVGTPSKRPDALIERLKDAVEEQSVIEEVWLALAHWPDSKESSWLLDVRSSADRDKIAALLNDVLRAGPFDGLPLDMTIKPQDNSAGSGIRIKPAELH